MKIRSFETKCFHCGLMTRHRIFESKMCQFSEEALRSLHSHMNEEVNFDNILESNTELAQENIYLKNRILCDTIKITALMNQIYDLKQKLGLLDVADDLLKKVTAKIEEDMLVRRNDE